MWIQRVYQEVMFSLLAFGMENSQIKKAEGRQYVDDVEISKFIVALTRTRKECHLIYNKWMIQPKATGGKYIPVK